MSRIDETRSFIPIGIAVLTVSDTRTLDDDKSGDTLCARLEGAGHRLAARAIVKDDGEAIRAQVRAWVTEDGVDAVITTGGTGFTRRDVTPDALEPRRLLLRTSQGASTPRMNSSNSISKLGSIICIHVSDSNQ